MKKCKMVNKDTKLHVAKTKRGKNKANRICDFTLEVKEPKEPVKINTTIKKQKVINSIPLSEDRKKFRGKKIQCPNRNQLDIFKYIKHENCKPSLPIFKKRQEILDLIEKNSVVLIHGEPESGITTQVPQFILDKFSKPENGSRCKIVSTQPYKKNVTIAYEKVSEERKKYFEDPSAINYVLRFDSHISRNAASITFCTSGILMKRILNSSYLNQITHLIIDEIQERDVCTDFLLAFFKRIISTRTNLKLILLCTSFIANKISKYFDKCPKINVSPKLFPVDKYFLEETVLLINFNNLKLCKKFDEDDDESKYPKVVHNFVKNYEKSNDLNVNLIIDILKYICSENKEGNILILLPSVQSMHFIGSKIKDDNTLKSITRIINLTNPEEKDIFNTNRKIFLACNERNNNLVANKIMFVIDAAKIRLSFYDIIANRETIKNDWISKNILKLRTNLAGRYKPGICFHLVSEDTIQTLDKNPVPKILLTDLEKYILEIKRFEIDNVETFLQNCLTPPDSACVKKTIEIFKANNILDDKEILTPLGFLVSKLPLKFPVGKMVIFGALFSCLDPILTIASCLTLPSIFQGKYKDIQDFKQNYFHITENCDFMLVVHLLNKFKTSIKGERAFLKEHFLRTSFVKDVNNITQQLKYRLTDMNFLPKKFDEKKFNVNSENINLIKALLSIALYPNIALIRNHNSDDINKITMKTVTNKPCCINSSSINKKSAPFPSPILMYKSSSEFRRRITLDDTSFVTSLQVLFFANNLKYSTENEEECIIDVIESLKVSCSTSTCESIKNVQDDFNKWLENILKHPTHVNWKKGSQYKVLGDVLELLNKESGMKFEII